MSSRSGELVGRSSLSFPLLMTMLVIEAMNPASGVLGRAVLSAAPGRPHTACTPAPPTDDPMDLYHREAIPGDSFQRRGDRLRSSTSFLSGSCPPISSGERSRGRPAEPPRATHRR